MNDHLAELVDTLDDMDGSVVPRKFGRECMRAPTETATSLNGWSGYVYNLYNYLKLALAILNYLHLSLTIKNCTEIMTPKSNRI